MSYLHFDSAIANRDVLLVLFGFLIAGAFFLIAFLVAGVVEEWNYEKDKSAQDYADYAGTPDDVGSRVVRSNPRRKSILPWVK